MRRASTLGALVAVGSLSMALVAAQQQPQGAQERRTVEIEKLADNLFVLTGGGGNTAVFIQAAGVTVVDTKNPGWGQPILDAIRELTSKPVTTVINTHSHYDHVSGNVEFPANVEVVAHENAKASMERWPAVFGLPPELQPQGDIFDEHEGRNLPTRTFQDRLTVGSGDDRIDLYYFGRGHTDGDAWIVFPALRVMHSGDIFANKSVPIADLNAGGSVLEYPQTLANAAGLAGVDRIIPGHSTIMTMADLKEFAAMMAVFVADMREAKQAGQTVDEVVDTWKIPERYEGYSQPPAAFFGGTVQAAFSELD